MRLSRVFEEMVARRPRVQVRDIRPSCNYTHPLHRLIGTVLAPDFLLRRFRYSPVAEFWRKSLGEGRGKPSCLVNSGVVPIMALCCATASKVNSGARL